MKTIPNKIYTNTIEIKKSKFITIIGKVTSKEELHHFLEQHSDLEATHNCYAYKFGVEQISGGYHDDGEPAGSAGLPIFKVIENNELTNIIILVIRHFGGIKLGQGPLTRAYGKSASETLKLIELEEIKKIFQTTISFSVQVIKKVDYFLLKNNCQVIDKQFDQLVHYTINSDKKLEDNPLFTINKQINFYK